MGADLPGFEVVCIGNAIVDVLWRATDGWLDEQGLDKGTMTLLEPAESDRLYAAMGPATEMSGGSAANTAVGIASLGGRAAFVGKVRDDELGAVFRHDIVAAGVHFASPPAGEGPPTARSLVMVTPDAERTMATCLGIAGQVDVSDLPADWIGPGVLVYVEGYLCGLPSASAALDRAAERCRAAGGRLALSLSDPAWVEHQHAELDRRVDQADIVFANAAEACALTGTDDAAAAADRLGRRCAVVAVTLGAEGSLVVSDGRATSVPAAPVQDVVDTTGAGDLYAAGFLFGLARGYDAERCARLGALAAGEIISHLGARPQSPLRDLVAGAGLVG